MKTKILLISFLSMLASAVMAQIILVPDEYPSIQEGINAAQDGDTILVAQGTYFENINYNGKAITVSSYYLIDPQESFINSTVIDGSQSLHPDTASTVMFLNNEDTLSVLYGFTIQGGSGIVDAVDDVKFGGGIACWESGPKISHVRIMNNLIGHPSMKVEGAGIGARSESIDHWMVVENSTISTNVLSANAFSCGGGGIYAETNIIIRNSNISSNVCFNVGFKADGGGVKVWHPGSISTSATIVNSTIQENKVLGVNGYGAGIALYFASGTIINNDISSNTIEADAGADGGGIYLQNSSNVSYISNNFIDGNEITGEFAWGGGIETVFAGDLHISDNQITNNSCTGTQIYGGGINSSGSSGPLFLIGNIISDNSMDGVDYWFGGGMWIDTYNHPVVMEKNRFLGNGGNVPGIYSLGGGLSIYSISSNEYLVNRNIFRQNQADNGGGIWTFNTYNSRFTNNIFFWNESEINGGAITFREFTGKKASPFFVKGLQYPQAQKTKVQKEFYFPEVVNNTFFGNVSQVGGAIYTDHAYDLPVIANSVFLINDATNGPDIFNGQEQELLVTHSCLDTTSIYGAWNGNDNFFEDPELSDDSCHLALSSPCINSGIVSFLYYDQTIHCPLEDIDGNTRPLNGNTDVGVDEVLITGEMVYAESEDIKINNYPNPFGASTTIEYMLSRDDDVVLQVIDLSGTMVEELYRGRQLKGLQKFVWHADGNLNGIYLLRLEHDKKVETLKMIILK